MVIHSYINSLNAGELSPLLHSRTDSDKYRAGCVQLVNMIPLVQGGVRRRPGIDALGIHIRPPKLLGFNFSTTTSFVIEFTDLEARFWSNGALVQSLAGTGPLKIGTPFQTDHLQELQSCQLNDVIYLADGHHMPRVLERYGDQDWRMRQFHEPQNGFASINGNYTLGAAGWEVEVWVVPERSITTMAQASSHMAAFAPTTIAGDFALSVTPASIQRTQVFFRPPTTATYEFYLGNVQDGARLRFSPVAGLSNLDARTVIQVEDTNPGSLEGTSPAFNLVAGQDYWMELVLNDFLPPGSAVLQYRINGGAWQNGIGNYWYRATPPATPTETELIEGWPAMLDTNAEDKTLTPSATAGQIDLTASADTFQSGHVGSYWQIAHYRDAARTTLGTGTTVSPALRIVGSWDVTSYGRWTGTVLLKRRALNSPVWETIRSWQASSNERNIAASGTETEECELRLEGIALVDNGSSSGAAFWVLEAVDTRITGLVQITKVTDPKTAEAYVVRSLGGTGATKEWAEGAWSDVRGYPNAVAFYEQRLYFGGTTANPQSIWGSAIGDFENFQRGTYDDNAVSFTLAAADGNPIQWLASQQGLIAGTTGDEWLIDSGSTEKPITPTNVRVKRQSRYGSAHGLPALIVGEVALFAQRGGRKVREFVYAFERDGWVAPDLTLLAEHITASGIVAMAYQSIPDSRLWCVLADGSLISMVYERDQKVIAWSQHRASYYANPTNEPSGFVNFKSVATIYGTANDEVWFTVQEPTDGLYYICRMNPAAQLLQGNGIYADFRHAAALTYTDTNGDFFTQSANPNGTSAQWLVQPVPLAIDLQDGTNRGRLQRVARLSVEFRGSSAVQFTDDFSDSSVPTDTINFPSTPFTGQVDVVLSSRFRQNTSYALTGNGTGYVHISGIVAKWEPYGD